MTSTLESAPTATALAPLRGRVARGGVLVLGGGFAGAYVARQLGRNGATIVNPTNFMLYTPLLPEAAAGQHRAPPRRGAAAHHVPQRRPRARLRGRARSRAPRGRGAVRGGPHRDLLRAARDRPRLGDPHPARARPARARARPEGPRRRHPPAQPRPAPDRARRRRAAHRRAAADLRRRGRRLLRRRGDRRGLRDGRRGAAPPPAPGPRQAALGAGRRRAADPRPDARRPRALRRAHARPARRRDRHAHAPGLRRRRGRRALRRAPDRDRDRGVDGRRGRQPDGERARPAASTSAAASRSTRRCASSARSTSGRWATAPPCPTWRRRASPTRRPASTRCARRAVCRKQPARNAEVPTSTARSATWRRSAAATASRSWPACACAASPAGSSPAATTCCSCRSPRAARGSSPDWTAAALFRRDLAELSMPSTTAQGREIALVAAAQRIGVGAAPMLIAGIASDEPGIVRPGPARARTRPRSRAPPAPPRRCARRSLPGQQPLRRDQRGDEGHPADAHHPEREERGHQPPAAADADPAVLEPHPQRPEATRVPVLEEHRRAAAVAQAGVLRRGQLVEGRAEDHAAGDVAAQRHPTRGSRGPASARRRRSRSRALRRPPTRRGSRPRKRRGADRACPPRVRAWPPASRACASTIGVIDGSIIAAIIVTHTTTNQPGRRARFPGPASMPLMRSPVSAQPAPASTSSSATSATWILVDSAGAR